MSAYYNENDPGAAAWLRELIKARVIAPGDVDERSIEDVEPRDLNGYQQCHFFAGSGVWSYALRLAGWSDDRPAWTGSCPCQPFSAAGKGAGFADERHLWPAWFHFIEEHRPDVVFGEQVASPDGLLWLELVHADLEGTGYAVGPSDTCAAGFGAPQIRQRFYFVAESDSDGREGSRLHLRERRSQQALPLFGRGGEVGELDLSASIGRARLGHQSAHSQLVSADTSACALANRENERRGQGGPHAGGLVAGDLAQRLTAGLVPSGHVGGFWRDADWLYCRDGKYRPVEPGTFPLAHGAAARVGRLRGYGNAIVAEQAAAFIREYMSL